MKEIGWRTAKAGRNFGKDTLVIPIDTQNSDARLCRCAVWDCYYISIEDLKLLPKIGG